MAAPPDKPALIYKQIEDTADYYEPSIYSILQMYSSFEMRGEEKLEGFYPLTDVRPHSEKDRNGHIFAIGVLPPPNKVTQRPLDRSATMANLGIIPVDAAGIDKSKGGPVGSDSDTGTGRLSRMTLAGYQLRNPDVDVSKFGGAVPAITPCTGSDGRAPNTLSDGRTVDGAVLYNYGPTGRGPQQTVEACQNKMNVQQAWSVFRQAYKELYNKEPTPVQLQILVAHAYRETGLKWPNNNPAMIGNDGDAGHWYFEYPKRADGKSLGYRPYGSFSSPVAGAKAMIGRAGPTAMRAAEEGDVLGYLTGCASRGYFGESIDLYYNNRWPAKQGSSKFIGGGWPNLLKLTAQGMGPAVGLDDGSGLKKGVPKTCAFIEQGRGGDNEGNGFYDDRIKKNYPDQVKEIYKSKDESVNNPRFDLGWRFRDPSLYGTDCPFEDDGSVPDTVPDENIKKPTPEPKKKQSAEELLTEQQAFTQGWTRNFQSTQKNEAASIAAAIERMKAIPPLRMLINPSSFKVAKEKVISDGTWSRTGNVIHHWGDNQDKIEGSGKVAAFFTSEIGMSTLGLNRSARNWSKGYQNFLSLYLLYRNNAAIYVQDPGVKHTNFISLVGSIYIYYDGTLYIGSFDSFNITEDASSPFTLEYSFSFTVRAWYALDRPDPEEKHTYGNSTYGGAAQLPTKTDPKVIAESLKKGADRKLQAAGLAPALSEQEQKAIGDKNDPLVTPPTDIPVSAAARGSTGITKADFIPGKSAYVDALSQRRANAKTTPPTGSVEHLAFQETPKKK